MATQDPDRAKRSQTRDRIMDGAESALIELGIAHTTTKEVARRAEVSEPAIYVYFESKQALLEAVARERLLIPSLNPNLLGRAEGSSRATLTTLLESLFAEYKRIFAIYSAVLADAALTAALRSEAPAFPGLESVASWIATRQVEGRVKDPTDGMILARMMLGTAFHNALLEHAFGEAAVKPDRATLIAGLVELIQPSD